MLDSAQTSALAPGARLVEAGPGAGKTRTIIERMRTHSNDDSKGVALISFTNTAADEAKRRCPPNQLAAPNFVGTVDSFLHKFVVTPSFSKKSGKAPRYVTSWHELPDAASLIHVASVPGPGFRLGSFKIDSDGTATIGNALSQSDKQYLAVCKKAGKTNDLLVLGQRRIAAFLRNGTFDSDGARAKALQLLSDDGSLIAKKLAARFEEIIIDEFQDCSAVEVEIVEHLKHAGISVLVVADPDQAIYEFRDASTASYQSYRDSLNDKSIVLLKKNYRSSPAICALVEMLRSVGTGEVISGRPDVSDRIVVLAGSHAYQRAQFARELATRGISLDDSVVLAHEKKQARAIAGLPAENSMLSKGSHKTFKLLGSVVTIKIADSPQTRKAAIDQAQMVLLGLFEWGQGEASLPPDAQLELLAITRSHVASFLLDLLSSSGSWFDEVSATRSIRNAVESYFGGLSRILPKLGRSLVGLKKEHWQVWVEAMEAPVFPDVLKTYAHIHAVKGREYRAVLLSVEKQRGKDAVWDMVRSGQTDEALRVLYVGASRASDLLVLGCREKETGLLTALLEDRGVDYDLSAEPRSD